MVVKMEKATIISSKELCGKSRRNTVALERVVQQNALNRTGGINYNKDGIKDGDGFEPCSEKFVDNFLLRVLVADYLIHNKRYAEVGSINRTIRCMLDRHGLEKCKVKAISLNAASGVPREMITKMPFRMENKECGDTKYFYQEYKIACAEVDYGKVLQFLRTKEYIDRGIFLKDIDITMDYAGSFDREEVVNYMVTNHDFRCEGTIENATKTILDNSDKVGHNCLTYMETVNGMSTRSKIYNKMVQMLECKGVRDTVGCHWKNWVSQEDTRLARARDKASQRGLTRAEVTFYCENDIPSDETMEATLKRVVQYVDASLVYTTPFSSVWNAYCDCMAHSLVVVDRTKDIALLVYSYNELTQNISGQLISKWSEREMWSLANLTLNGKLPIDLIEVLHISKTGKGNERLQLSGARYFKAKPDGTNDFNTRLVSHNGVFTRFGGTEKSNFDMVKKAGLQPHVNCMPYLAHVKANLHSKVKAEFHLAQELSVNIPPDRVKNMQAHESDFKDAAKKIMEDRRPIEEELKQKREKLQTLEKYTQQYSFKEIVPLRDLKIGTYEVMALKPCSTQYGDKFIMVLKVEGCLRVCYSNKFLEDRIKQHLRNEDIASITDPKKGYLTLYNKPLAALNIKGWGRTEQRNVIVYCELTWTSKSPDDCLAIQTENLQKDIECANEKLQEVTAQKTEELPNITVWVPYKTLPNISELPIGSLCVVTGKGLANHYGQDKLVLQLENGLSYQAGEYLETCEQELLLGCKLLIEKHRVGSSRRKYAVCKIVQSGDWSGLVDYKSVPMLSGKNSGSKIADVKTVTYNSRKRKLVLLEDGQVYKIKKSRLENYVEPGMII